MADEWFYIWNPSDREEAFPAFTKNTPEKRDSWTWGASRRQKNHVEMIEEVLKGLVARGLDGARIFATIFLRKVRVLYALRGKMWDYEYGEQQEELQDPSSSRLLLALLKYTFYPLFILDNGMNLISKSLTVLTPA